MTVRRVYEMWNTWTRGVYFVVLRETRPKKLSKAYFGPYSKSKFWREGKKNAYHLHALRCRAENGGLRGLLSLFQGSKSAALAREGGREGAWLIALFHRLVVVFSSVCVVCFFLFFSVLSDRPQAYVRDHPIVTTTPKKEVETG